MRKYDDAEIANLELLLEQTIAQVAHIKRHHPVFIELRAQAAGLRRSKDGTFYYPEELEWLYKEQEE